MSCFGGAHRQRDSVRRKVFDGTQTTDACDMGRLGNSLRDKLRDGGSHYVIWIYAGTDPIKVKDLKVHCVASALHQAAASASALRYFLSPSGRVSEPVDSFGVPPSAPSFGAAGFDGGDL